MRKISMAEAAKIIEKKNGGTFLKFLERNGVTPFSELTMKRNTYRVFKEKDILDLKARLEASAAPAPTPKPEPERKVVEKVDDSQRVVKQLLTDVLNKVELLRNEVAMPRVPRMTLAEMKGEVNKYDQIMGELDSLATRFSAMEAKINKIFNDLTNSA